MWVVADCSLETRSQRFWHEWLMLSNVKMVWNLRIRCENYTSIVTLNKYSGREETFSPIMLVLATKVKYLKYQVHDAWIFDHFNLTWSWQTGRAVNLGCPYFYFFKPPSCFGTVTWGVIVKSLHTVYIYTQHMISWTIQLQKWTPSANIMLLRLWLAARKEMTYPKGKGELKLLRIVPSPRLQSKKRIRWLVPLQIQVYRVRARRCLRKLVL